MLETLPLVCVRIRIHQFGLLILVHLNKFAATFGAANLSQPLIDIYS